jgi:hypothetical protein
MSLTENPAALDKWTLKVRPAARDLATKHAEARHMTIGAWLAEAIQALAEREDSHTIDGQAAQPLSLPPPPVKRAGFDREELELLEHMTRVASHLEGLSPESPYRKTATTVLERRVKALKTGKTTKSIDAASAHPSTFVVTTC